MILLKRFVLVWPITALSGSLLAVLIGFAYENKFSFDQVRISEVEEVFTYSLLLSGIACSIALPTWLCLIIWFVLQRKKVTTDQMRVKLLSIHLISGLLTTLILVLVWPKGIVGIVPLSFIYLGIGHYFLDLWGLKPKGLP